MAWLLVALVLIGSGCGGVDSRRIELADWSEQYRNALRPSLLFLNYNEEVAEENRLLSDCMRARGWARYPVAEATHGDTGGVPPQLSAIQTIDERLRAAKIYGARLLLPSLISLEAVPYREFENWLHEQPDVVRAKYVKDFSGGHTEDELPAKGSCRARALDRMRWTFPSSMPAVEVRAGQLYEHYVVGSGAYQQAERAWRACMLERGFSDVGDPLAVWSPKLQRQVSIAMSLSPKARSHLARALTKQALAEHDCAAEDLDSVVRRNDQKVLEQLLTEFPEFARLVTT